MVGRLRPHTRPSGTSQDMGVAVTAYGPERCPYLGGRQVVASEVVWATERRDDSATNRLGQRGAYVAVAPEPRRVQLAVERMRDVIAAAKGCLVEAAS